MAMQVRGNLAVLERQGHLHQAGRARGGLEVADVGLDRADDERPRCVRRTPTSPLRARSDRRAPSPSRAPRDSPRLPAGPPRRRAPRESLPAAPRPFGAVRLELRPSCLAALPRITAMMRSRSACASASRLSTIITQPSPRPNPSAPRIERLAPAVGRHHAHLAETHERSQRPDDLDAARHARCRTRRDGGSGRRGGPPPATTSTTCRWRPRARAGRGNGRRARRPWTGPRRARRLPPPTSC